MKQQAVHAGCPAASSPASQTGDSVMKPTIDPFDALLRFLTELLGTKVSLTLVLDVFVCIFLLVVGGVFILKLRYASKDPDQDE
ncbi:hypothetical protein [Mariprofundus ferrooxydans]|uniref:hypothetical protein n=1 Tax=Mariprofundus ferrooxydans TaxID=314344 RepID=UPI001F0E671E|nr:hypothetical protein [Mariprofundus ferrooxydans]